MQNIIITILILFIIVFTGIIIFNISVETEYIPEVEVEETELRKTMINLYFFDMTTNEITKESRLIDSKELLKKPYEVQVQKIIDGSENENYESFIPEGTEVLETSLNNGWVFISFNKKFEEINYEKLEIIQDIIYNTISELKEVTSIKILIEGNEVERISTIISKKEDNENVNEVYENNLNVVNEN